MPINKVLFPIIAIILLSLFLPSVPRAAESSKFSPYIKTFPQGKIDWDQGLIHGVAKVALKPSTNKIKALSTARLIASNHIVELTAQIRLDDKRRLRSLKDGKFSLKLKAFLRHTEEKRKIISENSRKYYKVVRVPY